MWYTSIRVVCKLQARVVPIRPALPPATPIFSPVYYTTTTKCEYNSRVLLLDMSNVRNILQQDQTLEQDALDHKQGRIGNF